MRRGAGFPAAGDRNHVRARRIYERIDAAGIGGIPGTRAEPGGMESAGIDRPFSVRAGPAVAADGGGGDPGGRERDRDTNHAVARAAVDRSGRVGRVDRGVPVRIRDGEDPAAKLAGSLTWPETRLEP